MAPNTQRSGLSPGTLVYYPAHGVGTLVSIEEREAAGTTLELYVVSFERSKLRVCIPTQRAAENGLVTLESMATPQAIEHALKIIRRSRTVKKHQWERRATAFEQKTKNGDLIALAEVVRDLNHNDDENPSKISYLERKLLQEAALRLSEIIAKATDAELEDVQSDLNERLEGKKQKLQFSWW